MAKKWSDVADGISGARPMWAGAAMTLGATGNNPMAVQPHTEKTYPPIPWFDPVRYGVPRALLDNAFLAERAIFRDGDVSPIVDGVKNVAAGLDATGHMIMRIDGAEPYDYFLMSDGSIQTPQMYDDALSMALTTMTPEMTETGTGEAASLASNSPKMYNLPTLKPRPFEADYPLGAPSDASGRLTADTLGNPLGAKYVVGRAMVGEPDVALPAAALDSITEAFVPTPKERVAANALTRGAVGLTTVNRFTRGPTGVNRAPHGQQG